MTPIEIRKAVEDGGFLKTINEEASRHFDFACDFRFNGEFSKWIIDVGGGAEAELTATTFLCRIFKSAQLSGDVYLFPKENELQVVFHVGYKHPGGGGNGRTVGRLIINTKTNEATWMPDEIL